MPSTPMVVQTRPFAVEPLTGIMMPDGIFDNALYQQRIACHYTNTSGTDLTNVTLYLESISDPGIVVTGQTYTFAAVPAGASVLVSWAADFRNAVPGKPMVSFVARADGFTSQRSIRQIFVSQTRYDAVTKTFSCTIPEGRLDITGVRVVPPSKDNVWWPGGSKDDKRHPWRGPSVPTGLTMVWTPNPAYPGVHGELPFQDPWWKVLALIVLVIAAIVGIIAAVVGSGTFSIGVEGTFDETDPGIVTSCCTPAPIGGASGATTVAGVAGAVASAALCVALADDADPFWRGQAATPPAAGEKTIGERVKAQWRLLDEPHAGTPYRAKVAWSYDRFTTGASYHHEVSEVRENIHVTKDVTVTTPATVSNGGTLWVEAKFVRPDHTLYAGPDIYGLALFQAPGGLMFVVPLHDDGLGYDHRASDGVYTASLSLEEAGAILKRNKQTPIGTWRVYLFGQDVNRVAPGTAPEIAAQTIGGFFVGSAVQITFDPSLPCPLKAQGSIEVV